MKCSEADRLAFVTRVLAIYDEADMQSELYWRVNPDLHLFAKCNDLFWWATADLEEITPANLPILEQVLVELQALEAQCARTAPAGETMPTLYLGELFAARVRKMRPQQPCYRTMSSAIAGLFDACGPVRDPKDEG